jgi:hypothetical protein
MYAFLIGIVMIGCVVHEPAGGAERSGVAELRVDPQFLPGPITRVTAECGGASTDLVKDPDTGEYSGKLVVPTGLQTVVVSAFVGDDLVGQSAPTAVEITDGVVTRVFLLILDLTESRPPQFGPIFDSLAFPTTVIAGATATFALSVGVPAGVAVSYAWSSDCADASFTAPAAATTGWSKPSQGVCGISVSATASGFTVSRSFAIVVFPAAQAGALDLEAQFAFAPRVVFQAGLVGCFGELPANSSCPQPIASPTTMFVSAIVTQWGSGAPGTLTLTDDCGGEFLNVSKNTDSIFATWRPPVTPGVCVMTTKAQNTSAAVGARLAAILVQAGTPPPAP